MVTKKLGNGTRIGGVDDSKSKGLPTFVYREGDINKILRYLPREKAKKRDGERILTYSAYTFSNSGKGEYLLSPTEIGKKDETTALRKIDVLDWFNKKKSFQGTLEERFPIMFNKFSDTALNFAKRYFEIAKNYEKAKTKMIIEHANLRADVMTEKEKYQKIVINHPDIPPEKKDSYLTAVYHLDHWFLRDDLIIGRERSRCDLPIPRDQFLSDQQGLFCLRDNALFYMNIGTNGALPLIFKGDTINNLNIFFNGENPVIDLEDSKYQLTYLLLGMEKVPNRLDNIILPDSYAVLEYPNQS